MVTSTLVLEGEGRVKEYAGGYDDWLRQRQPEAPPAAETGPCEGRAGRPAKERRRRLTYQEQRELEALPERIVALEAELGQWHASMADPRHLSSGSGRNREGQSPPAIAGEGRRRGVQAMGRVGDTSRAERLIFRLYPDGGGLTLAAVSFTLTRIRFCAVSSPLKKSNVGVAVALPTPVCAVIPGGGQIRHPCPNKCAIRTLFQQRSTHIDCTFSPFHWLVLWTLGVGLPLGGAAAAGRPGPGGCWLPKSAWPT